MKILILGGTRFIGKALAKSLSSNKFYKVDVFSKRKSKLKKINKQYFGNLQNNFINSTSDYDLIIDFISREKIHIDNVLKNFNFNLYFYVSTMWVDKKNKYKKNSSKNFNPKYLSTTSKKYINYKLKIESLLKKRIKKKLKIIRLPIIFSLASPRIKYYFDRIFYSNNLIQSKNFNYTYLYYSELNSIVSFFNRFIQNINRYKKQTYFVFSTFVSMHRFVKIITQFLRKRIHVNLYSKLFLLKNYKQYLHTDPFINEYLINFSNKNLIKLKPLSNIRSLIFANIKKFKVNAKNKYLSTKEKSFINKFTPYEKIIL